MTVDELEAVIAADPDAMMHRMLPDRSFVPAPHHITEVGRVRKDVIDCGGIVPVPWRAAVPSRRV